MVLGGSFNYSVAIGDSALHTGNGSNNVGIGYQAVYSANTSNNTGVGYQTLYNATGAGNTAFGANSGTLITTGAYNTLVGAYQGGVAPISAINSNFVVLSDGQANIAVSWQATTGVQTCYGPVVTKGYTVAGLASIASPVAGMRVHVTDANAPSFLATLAGGGSIRCPAFYDGTNWVAG